MNSMKWNRILLFIIVFYMKYNVILASIITIPLGCTSDPNELNIKLSLELAENDPFKCIDLCRNKSESYVFVAVGGNSPSTCSCADDFDSQRRSKYSVLVNSFDECSDTCPGDLNSYCGFSSAGYRFRSWYYNDIGPSQGGWEALLSRGREDSIQSDRFDINGSITPKSRSRHTLMNIGQNSTILFGGKLDTSSFYVDNSTNSTYDYQNVVREGMAFNDVWSFNLVSEKWSVLHDGSGYEVGSAPWPRYGHVGAVINSTSIVVFGGVSTQFNRTCSELWIFHTDTKEWRLLFNDSNIVPPRTNAAGSMITLSEESSFKLFPNSRRSLEVFTVFGGNRYGNSGSAFYYDDFWAWSFEMESWVNLPSGPEKREGHSLVQHTSPFIVTLAMGQGISSDNSCEEYFYKMDIWSFNGRNLKWTKLSDGIGPWDLVNVRWQSDVPSPRSFHSAANWFDGLIIFGGQSEDYRGLNDAWFFNVEERVWKTIPYLTFLPSNRTNSAMASVPPSLSSDSSMKTTALLFGGDILYANERNDLWMIQMNTNYFDKFVYVPSGTSYAAFGGIVLLSVWMCVIFLTLGNYIPRKLKSARPFQLKNVTIPDREVFGDGQSKLSKKRKITALVRKTKVRGLENSGTFGILSDELVLHIFGFLRGIDMGRVSRVCQRFNILCNDPYLWRELYLAHWNGKKEEENRNRILAPGERRTLDFRSLLEEINVIIQAMELDMNNNNNTNNPANNEENNEIVPQVLSVEDGEYTNIELRTLNRQEQTNENENEDEDEDEVRKKREEELVKFKKMYIEKLNSYRKTWAEAKFQRIIKGFNTTFLLHICLLLISIWTWLVGIKLDRYTDLSWSVVFFPLWIIDAFLILTCVVISTFWIMKRGSPLRNVLKRFFPSLVSKRFCIRATVMYLCIIALTVLLWYRTIQPISLWAVFSPLLLILILTIIELSKSVIKRASTFANVCWLVFSVLALCCVLVVIAWAQQRIPAAFCLMLVPWWASDMIALMLMIVYIVRLGALGRVAGFLVYLFTIYLLTMVFLRIFLCLTFGDGNQCDNPRNFSWNLVFVTLHVLYILFAFPLVHFLRGKFTTARLGL